MVRIYTRDGRTHDTDELTLAEAVLPFGAQGGVIMVNASTRLSDGSRTVIRGMLIPALAVDFIEDLGQ